MATTHGQTDKATIGTRKEISITYALARETLLGTPVALPTSDPGTPQISFTILAADMPVLTGISTSALLFPAFVVVGGHNAGGGFEFVSFRLKKNGVEITQQNPTVDLACWTLTLHNIPTVQVGDVLDITLWTAVSGMSYDYIALAVGATQPTPVPTGTILLMPSYTGFQAHPQLVMGDPLVVDPRGVTVVSGDQFYSDFTSDFQNGSIEAGYLGLFAAFWGGQSLAFALLSDDVARPVYHTNLVPSVISYYPTSIRVPL